MNPTTTRRTLPLLLAPLLAFVALLAPAAAENEEWHLLLVDGQEAGYTRTWQSTAADAEHGELTETGMEMTMVLKRMGAGIRLETGSTHEETPDGVLVRLGEFLAQGPAGRTTWEGEVVGDELVYTVTTTGAPREERIDWPGNVPGPAAVQRRIVATGFVPGATFTVPQFVFSLGGEVLDETITILEDEDVTIQGKTQRLHKVQTRVGDFPAELSWRTDEGLVVRTATDFPGMFQLETVLADRDAVAKWIDGTGEGAGVEMFNQLIITSNVRLPRPRSLDAITYRIRPKREGAELPDLADERQEVLGDSTLRITLRVPPEPRRQALPIADPAAELREFLEPNAMLQSDAPEIVALAKKSIGAETDPWKAAQLLERAVYAVIDQKSLDVAFASALEVCRTGQGDCTEHAVLLAALCRAAGIPSRIAMGIVYVAGIFGGHAWTEVWIDGSWYALDGTIGRGSADPTHVRFGTMSLAGGGMGEGLLGIIQGLGSLDLEIVSVTRDGVTTAVAGTEPRAMTADGRFEDRIEGVSFAVPGGWTVVPGDADILDMSDTFVVAELSHSAGDAVGGTIEIRSNQVGATTSLDQVAAGLARRDGAAAQRIERRTASGIAGEVMARPAGGRVFAAIVGDTLYTVEADSAGEETVAAFEAVVGSLRVE